YQGLGVAVVEEVGPGGTCPARGDHGGGRADAGRQVPGVVVCPSSSHLAHLTLSFVNEQQGKQRRRPLLAFSQRRQQPSGRRHASAGRTGQPVERALRVGGWPHVPASARAVLDRLGQIGEGQQHIVGFDV